MSYTPAEIAQAAALLVQRIPGLTPAAATIWVTAEQGDNNNIIGVTYNAGGQQHLYQYSTLAQGALAAGNLWGARIYAPFRAAVAATSDPAKQLQAIAASPWNHPYYTSARSGFPAAIARLTGQPVPALTTAAAVSPAGGSSGGGTFGATPPVGSRTVADLLSALPPTHQLTASDVEMIVGELTVSGPNDPIIVSQRAYYTRYIGKPINKVPVSSSSAFGGQMLSGLGGIPADFGTFGWVPGLAVNVGILALILVLGYKGVTEVLG
jgi:hypothetical protein